MAFTFLVGIAITPLGVDNVLASRATGLVSHLDPSSQRFVVCLYY